MSLELEVVKGPSTGLHITSEASELTIGRESGSDLQMVSEDLTVGRKPHCRIVRGFRGRMVRIQNENKRKIWLRTAQCEVVLDRGDQTSLSTPVVIVFDVGGTEVMLRSSTDPAPSGTQVLLEKSQTGSRDAIAILIVENICFIRALVRKRMGPRLRNWCESGDIVQAALIDVVKGDAKHLFRSSDDLRNYVVRVIENKIRDEDRRRKRHQPSGVIVHSMHGGSSQGIDPPDPDGATPSQEFRAEERKGYACQLLEALPALDQEIFRLRVYEALGFKEIAERVGKSSDAARQRFTRGIERLLEEHGDEFWRAF